MYIEFVSLVNSSGETVKVAFGLTDMSGFTQLAAIISPANGDAAGLAVNWNLAEGDQLTAQVTGTADKGQVELIARRRIHDRRVPMFDVVLTVLRGARHGSHHVVPFVGDQHAEGLRGAPDKRLRFAGCAPSGREKIVPLGMLDIYVTGTQSEAFGWAGCTSWNSLERGVALARMIFVAAIDTPALTTRAAPLLTPLPIVLGTITRVLDF